MTYNLYTGTRRNRFIRDLGIDGMIILKHMLENSSVKVENGPNMLVVRGIYTAVKRVIMIYVLRKEY